MIRPLKFPLTTGMNVLDVPGSPQDGHLAFQRGDLCLWLNVDDSRVLKDEVKVYVALTGEALPPENRYTYLGTAVSTDGSFVVHAYGIH